MQYIWTSYILPGLLGNTATVERKLEQKCCFEPRRQIPIQCRRKQDERAETEENLDNCFLQKIYMAYIR